MLKPLNFIPLITTLVLAPSYALADMTGTWVITRIIKTTELQVNVKKAIPSRSMGIVETEYRFSADGTFTTAGGNKGTWKESTGRFSMAFDKATQAELLKQALLKKGLEINSVKVLKDVTRGTVYPNGIIGESTGVTLVDVTTSQGPYKAKLTVNFSFAGFTPVAARTTQNFNSLAVDESGIAGLLTEMSPAAD